MGDFVRVQGLNEFQKAVRHASTDLAKDLRRGLNEAATLVGNETKSRVPQRSGALWRSIKPRSTQREGRVIMGSDAVPYAGWINFGGAVGRDHSVVRPRVPEGRYLYPAYLAHRAQVEVIADNVLNRVADRAGL